MKTADNVGITYVNTVIGRGVLNSVVNLTLGTFNFTPTAEGTIDPDLVVAARLRMDLVCARNLHSVLGELLSAIDQADADGAKENLILMEESFKPNEKPN